MHYVKFPRSICPRRRHIAGLLVLGLWASLAVFSTVAKAGDWETTHFEVVVARVADDSSYSTGRKAWEAMLRTVQGTEHAIDPVPGLPGELSTGDGANNVSGGSGMSKQSCSCSCAEQKEVESIAEELSRRSDKSKGGIPDMQGINFGKMMCQIQCFEQYEACD